MQFGDVVELKSGGPKMRVEWEIGVTLSPLNSPVDVNEVLKQNSGYDNGDNSCVWNYRNKIEKKIFPVEALIKPNTTLVTATNQIIGMGSVVKVNGENQPMTVNWVIGVGCRPSQLIDLDQLFLNRGFAVGDVSCIWFNRGKLHEALFRAAVLIKVFE